MMQVTEFRIIESKYGADLPKGVRKRYQVVIEGEDFVHCDTEKSALTGETRILVGDRAVATLKSKGFMASRWDLFDQNSNSIGKITGRGGLKSGWRLHCPSGREFELLDPTSFGESLLRNMVNGSPDCYVLVEGKEEVGLLDRKPRQTEKSDTKPGFFNKLKKLMQDHDWCLNFRSELPEQDYLIFIAGVLANIEVTAVGNSA